MEPLTDTDVPEVEWGGATFSHRREGSLCTLKPGRGRPREPPGACAASLWLDFLHPGEKWMGPVPPAVTARL